MIVEPALGGRAFSVLGVLVPGSLHVEVLAPVCGATGYHALVMGSSVIVLVQVLAALGTSTNWNVLGMVPVDPCLLLAETESLGLVVAATLRECSLVVVSV